MSGHRCIAPSHAPDIPPGFQVAEVPEPVTINDDLMKLEYQLQVLGDKVKIEGVVAFKKTVYQPAEYTLLRKRMETVVSRFNEVVILKPL